MKYKKALKHLDLNTVEQWRTEIQLIPLPAIGRITLFFVDLGTQIVLYSLLYSET